MKTIHKYRLEGPKKLKTLTLPEGFKVVRSEYLITEKAVYIWVEEPLNAAIPRHEHQFRVALSGEPVPSQFAYRGTALDTFGPEAYHIYEVIEAANGSAGSSTSALREQAA